MSSCGSSPSNWSTPSRKRRRSRRLVTERRSHPRRRESKLGLDDLRLVERTLVGQTFPRVLGASPCTRRPFELDLPLVDEITLPELVGLLVRLTVQECGPL